MQFYHKRNTFYLDSGECVIESRGGYTFCIEETDSEFLWGISHCSSKENYCKETGRNMSMFSIESGKGFKTPKMNSLSTDWFVHILFNFLKKERRHFPTNSMIWKALDISAFEVTK